MVQAGPEPRRSRAVVNPFWILLLALLQRPALATTDLGEATSPGNETSRFQVALVTVGPGALYFERFGHNALLVADRLTGRQTTYNYGIFDFEERHFFLNFALGHMRYRMTPFEGARDIPFYIRNERRVTLQRLDLDQGQLDRLLAHLGWNERPENATYDYHYFDDNCSTRVRDALDLALDGALGQHFRPLPGHHDLRFHVNRLTRPQPWAYVATHLALGPSVDRPISRWQEFFLPMELATELDEFRHADGRPLVVSQQLLSEGAIPEPDRAPAWWPIFLAVGLLLGLLQWRFGTGRGAGLWWLINGGVGSLLVFLWLFTEHRPAHGNLNLMLFSPLALLPAWQLLRGTAGRAARDCAALLTALTLVAGAQTLSPWAIQSQLEFVLLALPINGLGWLALRSAERRHRMP